VEAGLAMTPVISTAESIEVPFLPCFKALTHAGDRVGSTVEDSYFRILGPVEVELAGQRVRLGPSLRLLLSVLVLKANQPVSGAALRTLPWGGGASPTDATVRSHIQHLRQALEPRRLSWAPPSVLVTEGDGYVLRVQPEQRDTDTFEALVEQARRAMASGEPAAAAESLRAALALWRGPVLAGLAGLERVDALGIAAEVARLYRLRETARAALTEAEDQVDRQIAGDLVENRSRTQQPRQLPPGPARFIGRDAELEMLRDHLAPTGGRATTAVVAIDGQPGVGKSALALNLAHGLAPEFPDGVLYVRLHGADSERVPRSAHQALSQLLTALGVHGSDVPSETEEASARYRTELAERRVLVVLDDAADAAQVRPLLPGGPGCAVLIPSRARLALPEALPFRLDLLSESHAIEMLDRLDGTGRVRRDPAAAAMIANACGRLPLAVQIAAARLGNRPSWTSADLAARLADEHRRLAELQLGELDVRACFELSYRSLDVAHRRLFRLLSLVETPDFTVAATAGLLDLGPGGERLAEPMLERLLDEQLLEQSEPDRYRFHDLLRLFAHERVEDEEPPEERAAVRLRALGWYLTVAERADSLLKPPTLHAAGDPEPLAGLRLGNRQAALAWLESERANLVAVVRQAGDQDDPAVAAIAWRLADTLFRFFDLRKYWVDWLAVCEPAVRAARRSGDRVAEAWAVNRLATVLREQRRVPAAIAHLTRALAISRKARDVQLQCAILNSLGIAYQDHGDLMRAVQCHQQRRARAEAGGDRLDQAVTLNNLGDIHREQRHYDEARRCFERCLEIFEDLGEGRYVGMVLHNLGEVALDQGRHDEAVDWYERGLGFSREADDKYSEAHTLLGLGRALTRSGHRERAVPLWRLARDILDALEAPEAGDARRLLGEEYDTRAGSGGGVA
jgi:tetratricopeptide (TPR) repeat protein/DNA-binding winged helix-turn-helix (wHTH) protein